MVGIPERQSLLGQVVRQVGGIDEAALSRLEHGVFVGLHGLNHGDEGGQAHFDAVDRVKQAFLVFLHVLVIG